MFRIQSYGFKAQGLRRVGFGVPGLRFCTNQSTSVASSNENALKVCT